MDTARERGARRHAILIGINHYVDKPLRGCVRDVKEWKKHLESLPDSINIKLFTATPGEGSNSIRLLEDPSSWPTYTNVTASIRDVTVNSTYGDFVYILYSGHGFRVRPSNLPTSRYACVGDVGLAVIEGENGEKVRYLRGLELAHLVKALVAKGVVVTLVLDCCFSAAFSRRDGGVEEDEDGGTSDQDDRTRSSRYLEYDPEIDAAYEHLAVHLEHAGAAQPASRNATTMPSWVIRPDGYTILAACGPHEVAGEIELDGGERHGALSYLLLRTVRNLSRVKRTATIRDIYRHLLFKFQESCPKQNPFLYGNGAFQFFGPPVPGRGISRSIAVGNTRRSGVLLLAGLAHGVCKGDRFCLIPSTRAFDEDGASFAEELPVLVHAVNVEPLTSELEMVDQGQDRRSFLTDRIAKQTTWLSLRQFPIRLSVELALQERWAMAIGRYPSLAIHVKDDSSGAFAYRITRNVRGDYEIQDESSNTVTGLSMPPTDNSEASERILEIVQHLTRFKFLEQFTNRMVSSSFRETFTVTLLANSGEVATPGQTLQVPDGSTAFVHLQNRGNSAIYLSILNLNPSYEVSNLISGIYDCIPARDLAEGQSGEFRKGATMSVPLELRRASRKCHDILKVFITRRPTSFDAFEMPQVGRLLDNDECRQTPDSETDEDVDEGSGDWVALNFHVETTYDPNE